jgi:hypothetical protein
MMQRFLVIVGCVLLCATTSIAQNKPKADQITGTWTGELATQMSQTPISVTLKLTLDAKNAITGTFDGMPNPGDVKAGSTFDPKTGALKLQLGKTSDSAVLLTLDGTVVKGKATGKISGEGTGTFTLTKKS